MAPLSGIYPATYGFDYDKDGFDPEEWIIFNENPEASIIPELDGHTKVLRLNDTVSGSGMATRIYNNLNEQNYGTIETWIQQDNLYYTSQRGQFTGMGDGVILFGVRMWGGSPAKWVTTDNGINVDIIGAPTPSINTWYHIRIDFEHTSGGYQELSQNEYYVYIDGTRYGPYRFNANDSLDELHLHTYSWGSNYNTYFDAVGYSWDPNYNIGDNLKEGLLLSFETNATQFWGSYSVDGQTNITILGNTTISMLEDGPHTIQVFNKNLFGDLIQSELRHFTIDTKNPEIVIYSPNQYDIFRVIPPKYNISIVEVNLVSSWYTLDSGATNFTFTDLYGYIAEDAWLTAPNGSCIIEFYAKDVAGKIGYKNITVLKDVIRLLNVDILSLSISDEIFNVTLFVYNELNDGIDSGTIQMWWDGIDVSSSVQNLGNGLYFIMLYPITVAIGENPILLNMTISVDGYLDKYYETFISVQPRDLTNLLFVEIIDCVFSIEEFNITFSVFNESGHAISFATIQMWWNGIDVSPSVQNLGSGLYFILLDPITVAIGEDPILLNMTITVDGYLDKYYDTLISVQPWDLPNLIFVEIIDCFFSIEEFNITFSVFNESGQIINLTTIQLWWNGIDVSSSVQNLGSGLYFIILDSITVASGENLILLNMTMSADGYLDKYYETYIARQPCELSNLLFVEIIDSFFSLEEFNITFSVFNESGHAISFLTIQLWWNGIDVSSSVQDIGDGLYFVSLEPITVVPGSDPIILTMIVSASGYGDKHFTTKLSVDPETLQKMPEEGDPTEENPLPIIIIIALISSGATVSIITILFLNKRRKTE